MPFSRRNQDTRGLTLRQGQTEEKLLTTPKVTRPLTYTTKGSMTHTITLTSSPTSLVRITSEVSEPSGPNSQGRMSTLSSIVRPTPITATRTMAITQEGLMLSKQLEDYWDLLPLLFQ